MKTTTTVIAEMGGIPLSKKEPFHLILNESGFIVETSVFSVTLIANFGAGDLGEIKAVLVFDEYSCDLKVVQATVTEDDFFPWIRRSVKRNSKLLGIDPERLIDFMEVAVNKHL